MFFKNLKHSFGVPLVPGQDPLSSPCCSKLGPLFKKMESLVEHLGSMAKLYFI